MKKKLLSVVLVAAMGMLTACGTKDAATSGTAEQPAGTAEQSQEEATGAEAGSATGDKVYQIGYTVFDTADEYTGYRADVFKKTCEATGAMAVNVTNAENDQQKQIDQVDNFINQGCDAVVITAVDQDGAVPAVEACNNAGIPCFVIGASVGGGDYYHISSETYEGGYVTFEYLCEVLPESAKICYMQGALGFSDVTERQQARDDAIEKYDRGDIQILAEQTGNWVAEEAMTLTEDWLSAYPDVNAIVCQNDAMALGAIEALKVANKLDDVIVTGVDGTNAGLEAVKAGEMLCTGMQDALGQSNAFIEVFNELQNGGAPEKVTMIPFTLVTADNVDEYLQ